MTRAIGGACFLSFVLVSTDDLDSVPNGGPDLVLEKELLSEEMQVLHLSSLLGSHFGEIPQRRRSIFDMWRATVEPEGVFTDRGREQGGFIVDCLACLKERRQDALWLIVTGSKVESVAPIRRACACALVTVVART